MGRGIEDISKFYPNEIEFTLFIYNLRMCKVHLMGEHAEFTPYGESTSIVWKGLSEIQICRDGISRETVLDYLAMRAITKSCPRWPDLYKRCGIEEYNPWEFCLKNHGFKNGDKKWLLFKGDTWDYKNIWYVGGREIEDYTDEKLEEIGRMYTNTPT